MSHDSPWNFKFSAREEVACGWFEEEERFFWDGVVELFGDPSVVPAYTNDLSIRQKSST